VNKLAKSSTRPGKNHSEAILHVLRYLRDNSFIGLKFYSNAMDALIIHMLINDKIQQDHPFFTFLDSSWNDDVDSGRSTGCFLVGYMGGIVDHSLNLPDPVANEGCIAFMATSHLRMLLLKWRGILRQKWKR
jgi:hypothetical protein